MAYHNVTTPRFIIDYLQFYKYLGYLTGSHIWNGTSSLPTDEMEAVNNMLSLYPTNPTVIGEIGNAATGFNLMIDCYNFVFPVDQCNIVGFLGHNFADTGGQFQFSYKFGAANWDFAKFDTEDNLIDINITHSDINLSFPENGFSFLSYVKGDTKFNQEPISGNSALQLAMRNLEEFPNLKLGSILWGTYFDMPHSSDLNITMSVEMDGAIRQRSKGGSDMVDFRYQGSPKWATGIAFDRETNNLPHLGRKGRRSWTISFSHLQDSDIFPEISNLNNYDTIQKNEDTIHNHTIGQLYNPALTTNQRDYGLLNPMGTNYFYSELIHKTAGGALPFVLMPDKDNFNDFALCKLDMDQFSFNQQSHNIYQISLKLVEVW